MHPPELDCSIVNQVVPPFGLHALNTGFTPNTGFALNTDFFGQAVFGPAGVYVGLPIYSVFPEQGDSDTALGNLELGGIYHAGFGVMGLTVRLGVVVPTSPPVDSGGHINRSLASHARLTDIVQTLPDAITIRLGVSPQVDAFGFLFARADVGVDIVVSTEDRDTKTLFRGNVAVGAGVGIFKVALELVNLGDVGSNSKADISDQFHHQLAMTLSFTPPIVHPFISFITPLDDAMIGELYVISLGAKAVLPF